MGSEIIVGEAIVALLQVLAIWARDKGLTKEQCLAELDKLWDEIEKKKPEYLPDV